MSELQQDPLEPAPQRSNRKWIALALGGGCALLACIGLVIALAISFLKPASTRTVQPQGPVVQATIAPPQVAGNTPTAAPALQKSGNTLGDPNAPVKIIEYADFQCPFCQRHWMEVEPRIIETYVKTGKVSYEFRSVGAFLGPESADAAEAAYCAGDQDKFWEYHDALFSHWTGENVGDFTRVKLDQYAQSIALDQSTFDTCLDSAKYTGRVQQDAKDAKADGVKATPSFIINGTLLEGALPFAAFQQAIDAALQGK
jgi:protein-disulfide isomerase